MVVVGGGITGLLTAWHLDRAGRPVTVVEATARVGGQIDTIDFAGRPVDLGAEAVHLAAPGMRDLLEQLGLLDGIVRSGPGGTLVGVDAPLRRLPAGVGPAGPTRLWPLVTSGIVGPLGLARAALEPWVARRRIVEADVSVRDFVAGRFGAQVADRLVDPLLGGLHSGDISRLSLRAATPQLAAMARSGRSITLSRKARRAAPSVAPAAFATWPTGLGRLPDTLAANLADVRLGHTVEALETAPGQGCALRIRRDDGTIDTLEAAAVVLAVPSTVAARLLAPVAPAAADALAGQRFASVATAAAAFPREAARGIPALQGTGILLGSGSARVLKAATFLSTKWPHLAEGEHYVLRLSAGRAGSTVADDLADEPLVEAMLADLRDLTGLAATPSAVWLRRWPATVPQLEVGHPARLARARQALTGRPVLLAGASYAGVGIASCVRSAQAAAQDLLSRR